jgi:hypothetical protein
MEKGSPLDLESAMRTPSAHAEKLLGQLLLQRPFTPDELKQLLVDVGRQGLVSNINWSEPAASYVRHFVSRSAVAGALNKAFMDALGAHEDLLARKPDLDRIRVYLELIPSGTSLVGSSELAKLKQLALKAGLHQPLVFARLGQVTLPPELRRQAAQSVDKIEQVQAWIDAANRQEVLPGDVVWMVEIFKKAAEEEDVDRAAIRDALDLLGGKGLGGGSPVDVSKPDGLEQVVRQFGITLDAGAFFEGYRRASSRVCAVFVDGVGLGTGFLVGRDLVLTNHHVLRRVLEEGGDPSSVEFVFELVTVNGQEQRGPVARLDRASDAAKPWLVDTSPPTDVERQGGPLPELSSPTPDTHLDFALVRIDQPLGAGPRGAFSLASDFAFPKTAPLIILGHPGRVDGTLAPQVWAIEPESVLGNNATRVRYRTNTLRGSSGSPVMTMQWELVALHHFGKHLSYNQGIPVAALRARPAVAAALG